MQFGFKLEKPIIADDIRVKGIGKSVGNLGESVHAERQKIHKDKGGFKDAKALKDAKKSQVYFDGHGRVDTPVLLLESLEAGEKVKGPAILIDGTQTITLGE